MLDVIVIRSILEQGKLPVEPIVHAVRIDGASVGQAVEALSNPDVPDEEIPSVARV